MTMADIPPASTRGAGGGGVTSSRQFSPSLLLQAVGMGEGWGREGVELVIILPYRNFASRHTTHAHKFLHTLNCFSDVQHVYKTCEMLQCDPSQNKHNRPYYT